MANFVNLYERSASTNFRDILEYDEFKKELYIAGNISKNGLITKLDEKGKVLWEKQYSLKGETLSFQQIVKYSDGDLLAFGSHPTGVKWRSRNLIVRIKPDGTLVWARSYTSDKTRYNIKLIHSKGDNFYIASWYNSYSTVDDVEVMKFDANGALIGNLNFGVNNKDDQVKGIIPYGSGFLVHGSSSQGSGWDAFAMAVNSNMVPLWKKLIGGSKHESILDMVQYGTDKFFVVGYSVTRKKHFLMNYEKAANTHDALFFDAGSDDRNSVRLIQNEGGLYLLMYAKDISASFIMKLDSKLQPIWRKRLDIDQQYDLDALKFDSNRGMLLSCGRSRYDGTIALKADLDLTTCVTVDLPPLQFESISITSKEWDVPLKEVNIAGQSLNVATKALVPELTPLCPDTGIEIDPTSIIQSPYLYMQAAGSDTTDGSSRGIHLRWDLMKNLGANHLPKGNLTNQYPTNIGFNRLDDFVKIYRAKYVKEYNLGLDLTKSPNQLTESGVDRIWTYSGLFVHQGLPRDITLTFLDINDYDSVRAQLNPLQSPAQFLNKYRGVVELRVVGQLFFKVDFTSQIEFESERDSCVRAETISWPDTTDDISRYVSCRKKINQASINKKEPTYLVCENIDFVRFETIACYLYKINIVTYEDTLVGYQDIWAPVGDFSLTTNTAEAHKRLEDPAKYVVDGQWGKFNETDSVTGEFKVNVDNYKDRWIPATDPSTGLKQGIEKFLTLSQTTTQALDNILDDNGDAFSEVSYLEFLRLASLDYHGARMMGLGHIDGTKSTQIYEPFIYLAAYVTEAALEEGGTAGVRTHFYMCLPTRQVDHRLPLAPSLNPVTYGLFVDNGTANPTMLSDGDGYTPFENDPHDYVRYININRNRYPYEYSLRPFFDDNKIFCLCENSQTVSYGLEYKEINEPIFRRPEILNDIDYDDPGGLPEVMPIPEKGDPDDPVYTHMEIEEGIHRYGLYGINWFSRVSPVSNLVDTNMTDFPKRNSLLPPANFAAQIIQEENPLIFTTNAEQQMLTNIATADKTLVRVTFDWNQLHNIAYQAADEIEFFYRDSQPITVGGDILSITTLSNNRVRVFTKPYPVDSASPPTVVQPFMAAGDAAKFEGSLFVANEKTYVVESVTTGNNPQFTLKKLRYTEVFENADGEMVVVEDFEQPQVDERFLVYENLSDPVSWDFKLNKSMLLNQFAPLYTEDRLEEDGQITVLDIGGVAKPTNVAIIPDPADNVSPTGAYTITFNSYSLPPIADPDAAWYGGTIRILEDAANFPATTDPDYRAPEMKVLQVLAIDISGPNLVVKAYDPTFSTDASTGNPYIDYMPIEEGNNVNVNFHPSYRLYLTVDNAGTHNFDEVHMIPAQGDGTKTTFLAARSKDTVDGVACHSYLSKPATILAQEVITLEPPGELTSEVFFATRPDFYGKATYTFDVPVDTNGRTPYAVIFYRSDERKILDTLYLPQTVETILNDLFTLFGENDGLFTLRWNGLVNVILSGGDFETIDGYTFPRPDNNEYLIPNSDPTILETPFAGGSGAMNANYTYVIYKEGDGTPVTTTVAMSVIVAEAIQGAFLSLTEQPVLYKYIQDGYSTSNRRPLLRDPNGDLIVPETPNDFSKFDPFPMSVKHTDAGQVLLRFTDYTLDGSSKSFFFYFAVELSKKMEVSEASPILGPIQLVNAAPAEQPGIKKIVTEKADVIQDRGAFIRLELNEFIEVENIKKYEIYRATNNVDALTVRTMELAKTYDVGEDLIDDFADLAIPPYGDPIFYRVVALREIRNEQDIAEFIPSKPSELALASLLDEFYPPSPILSYTAGTLTAGSPPVLPNVSLSWNKTVHNGIYHVYKWTKVGNWEKIYELTSNDAVLNLDLLDTTLNNDSLIKEDDEGYEQYHQFRVLAQNASGLISLDEQILVI